MPDQSIAIIVGVACSLAALVLAWRAYRGAADEHERRKRDRQKRD
jgi:multisubunit Na+/H+ antiporter MnhC subunit